MPKTLQIFLSIIGYGIVLFLIASWLWIGFSIAGHGGGSSACTSISGDAYQCGD